MKLSKKVLPAILLTLSLALASCSVLQKKGPVVKVYYLDAHEEKLVRKQDNEEFSIRDPKAQGFFCVGPHDLELVLNSCSK